MKLFFCLLLWVAVDAVAAEQAVSLSEKDAASSKTNAVASFKDCPDCPEMLLIPAGKYSMGSTLNEDEGPVHQVETGDLVVGKYHVTRGQYAAFVKDTEYDTGKSCFTFEHDGWQKRTPLNWRNPGFKQDDNHPAVCLSWYDAKAYTEWLTKKTGKAYRLLSEAEWEYAARAGTTTSRYWGDAPDQACEYANVSDLSAKVFIPGISWAVHDCSDGAIYTSAAGNYKPNAFGLYDMLGNAWQWVEDCYVANYQDAASDGTPRQEKQCLQRVMRGGSWSGMPDVVRAAKRNKYSPEGRFNFVGFRVARDKNK